MVSPEEKKNKSWIFFFEISYLLVFFLFSLSITNKKKYTQKQKTYLDIEK